MKKKKDEFGEYYIFSTDRGVETLCHQIIHLTREVEPNISQTKRLWEAGYIYVENADEDSMIFKRKPELSGNNELTDDVYYWIETAINTIIKTIGIDEKSIPMPKWKADKRNGGGVGYKLSEDGYIYSFNILSPYTYLKTNQKDFKLMLDDLQISFDYLHMSYHYRMMNDIKSKIKQAREKYPSIEIVVELDEMKQQRKKETDFSFTKPEVSRIKRKETFFSKSTKSVFDGIENSI